MKRRDFLAVSASGLGLLAALPASGKSWRERYPKAQIFTVSIGGMIPGQQVMFKTKHGPIVIRYRTETEIEAARAIPLGDLRDPLAQNANLPPDSPATDQNRTIDPAGRWFVFRPMCTHLGQIVQEASEPSPNRRAWIHCPSHGGRFDSAGRVLAGPAPRNLAIPIAKFVSDDVLEIHSNASTSTQDRVRDALPSTW